MKVKFGNLVEVKTCKGYRLYWDLEARELLMDRENAFYLVAKYGELFSVPRGFETAQQKFYRRKK